MDEHEKLLAAGMEHHRLGNLAEAERIYRQVLGANANHPAALQLLGVLAHQTGHLDAAMTLLRRAVDLESGSTDSHNSLGELYRTLGRHDLALAHFESAVARDPNNAPARVNLGNALHAGGGGENLRHAQEHLRAAVRLAPSAGSYCDLGTVLVETDLSQAAQAFADALKLNPDHAESLANLGYIYSTGGQYSQAIALQRRAAALLPRSPHVHENFGVTLMSAGELAEAIACFRRSVEIAPAFQGGWQNLLLALTHDPSLSGEQVFQEHRAWATRFADGHTSAAAAPHTNERSLERRLRVGYVSGDLREHAVASFFEPLLTHHRRTNVEVYCYSNSGAVDATTERLKRAADAWRDVAGMSDEQLAQQIRADAIDILVDLSGHTYGHRLLALALKPAPVQVTYLGYPGSTGMSAIDYRLTDAIADPPGMTDRLYTEKLLRLPRCAWCYQAPRQAPEVAPLPLDSNGYVTFGSLNKLAKVTPAFLRACAELLARVPDSRLLIKSSLSNEASTREVLGKTMAAANVPPERCEIVGSFARAGAHLAIHARVDVALDTHPYNGTTTTCESLYMGVPVITLAGDRHLSRVSASLLNAVGLADLVASSWEQYVDKAARLARQVNGLRELRAALRGCMRQSPLMDPSGLAEAVESAYRECWRRWCRSGGGESGEDDGR
jgi:predicted O-linked N-acetylglucosamine transferase (SPINDLY family)